MGRNRSRLATVLLLAAALMVIEAAAALWTGSLALLADAAHMLSDVTGLSLALFAISYAQKPASPEKTYGYYRAEILAALANAMILFFLAGFIAYEAFQRFQDPPVVKSLPMLAVAVMGLGVNLIGIWLLHKGSRESLNIRAAYLEVLSDTLGSSAVIAAALVMLTTGWFYADPLFSLFIAALILPRTVKLLKDAVDILLEAVPPHLSLGDIKRAIKGVVGVRDVHDLHVWTITSGFVALSAHIVVDSMSNGHQTLEELRRVLLDEFGIDHTTIQLEEEGLKEETIHT